MHHRTVRRLNRLLVTAAACVGLMARTGLAQSAPPVILEVDIDNFVQYFGDIGVDSTKFAKDPNPTTATPTTFQSAMLVGDIVAVNGKAVKGAYIARGQALFQRTTPLPGWNMSDVFRTGPFTDSFEFLQSDGTPIGTIMTSGQSQGPAPPGSPAIMAGGGNIAIIGGTGAFLGVRGQMGLEKALRAPRNALYTEDPANRRSNGGGLFRFVLYIIPMSRPDIVSTSTGPVIVHSSDFKLVTSSNPAHPGEILSLFATGLGPVRPSVDPGQPFPTDPLAVVNSPLDVTVNEAAADIIGAVGYPGSTDRYQVNFRVPGGAAPGTAQVRVASAWITSSAVSIAIQ